MMLGSFAQCMEALSSIAFPTSAQKSMTVALRTGSK